MINVLCPQLWVNWLLKDLVGLVSIQCCDIFGYVRARFGCELFFWLFGAFVCVERHRPLILFHLTLKLIIRVRIVLVVNRFEDALVFVEISFLRKQVNFLLLEFILLECFVLKIIIQNLLWTFLLFSIWFFVGREGFLFEWYGMIKLVLILIILPR